MIASARRGVSAVDPAIVQLVRLVREDPWSPSAAAVRLQAVVDAAVLRRARGRVHRALLRRRGDLGERAQATLDAALTQGGTP